MPQRKSLNVSITPELLTYIDALVASGRYKSASEVVRASLRVLEKHDPLTPSRTGVPGEDRRNVR
jgi:antitoxin ParD1/3/4